MSELRNATALAASVRNGDTTAADALAASQAAIGASDGEIHAFLHLTDERAAAQAAAVDAKVAAGEDPGPLAGVPIALKDNMCTRGEPTTCSSKILEGWRPPYDATVVEPTRAAAGAIVVGKTNLDEFAMGSSTENSAFGATRNPLDTSRVPAARAAGRRLRWPPASCRCRSAATPVGSIRQPAALCGVVGVKPTYGAVSRYGLIAFASSLDQIGPFAHSVEDARCAST